MSTTVAFALSRGMSLAEIEAATGLHAPSLGDPDARLPEDIPAKVWTALEARHDGSVALTVEAARAAPLTTLGGLAHGLQYAESLRQALEFLVCNQAVMADRLRLEVREQGSEAMLTGGHPLDETDCGRTSEVGMMITARVVREVLQQRRAIKRIDFRFSSLGPAASYQSFLKVPVAFEQPRAAIVFDAAAMTAPVPGQNADLFAFVDRHFCILRRQLAERNRAPAPSRLMRAIDEGAGSGDYRVSAAAHRAGLSVRAAQRLAMRDGTTLQRMIDDARRARAEALLSDPAISIEAAAALLGYSDDRAFRRAFKRWTDQSPSAYRRQA